MIILTTDVCRFVELRLVAIHNKIGVHVAGVEEFVTIRTCRVASGILFMSPSICYIYPAFLERLGIFQQL